MVITLDEAQARLDSRDNPTRVEFRQIEHKGNPLGQKGHGLAFQAEVAALAHVKSIREVSQQFGISERQVDNLKAARSDGEHASPALAKATEEKLSVVRDVALEKLMLSLGLINDTSTRGMGAKDAALVASAMAKVIDRTSDKRFQNQNNVLVIYAPPQRDEGRFQTVEVEI